MAITVTKTAATTFFTERWTNFSPAFLQYWDSYLAHCDLRSGDSEKWGLAYDWGFSIPAGATITAVTINAFWWGSNANHYILLKGVVGTPYGATYDYGATVGRWVTVNCSPVPSAAQLNGLAVYAYVGRLAASAVTAYIDQITVSVTYEPYVAPPPPPPVNTPTVTTQAVDGILSNSATGNGTVTSDGGSAITNRGFFVQSWPGVWGGTRYDVGGTTGAYTAGLTGLVPGTTYWAKAFAGNAVGYGYGNEVSFVAAAQKAGDGGAGIVSSTSGQQASYAGGGGGAMYNTGAGGSAGWGGGVGGTPSAGGGIPGFINSGGGGGGAVAGAVGGSGGKGVVVIRYKTADAVSTSPALSTSIFRPSIAYRGGRLFAPYSIGEDAKILKITGNTLANPTIVTTETAHGIPAGTAQVVVIGGSVTSVPSINGSHVATRISDTTFSIPVNVTTAGTAGQVVYNASVGWAITSGGCNNIGWLTQSPTTFHTGSMKKDFRYISVSHDILPDGASLRSASWLIDGVYGTSNGISFSPQETRFPIDLQGYSIETTLGMTPDYTGATSPVVRGSNVIWDFVKTPKHTYNLDCRKGAGGGHWSENPEGAIAALFQAADIRSQFEDRYNGVYTGVIDTIEFRQAAHSLTEGPSGLVKIAVREVT